MSPHVGHTVWLDVSTGENTLTSKGEVHLAHRMAFPANRGVPLAIKISEEGDGWLLPFDPAADGEKADPDDAIALLPNLRRARVDVFALDIAPSDQSETQDLLYVTASFVDPLGRSVDIRSTGVALGNDCEHFGGVGANMYCMEGDRWSYFPLRSWARFEVRIDGLLTDADLLGTVTVTERLDDSSAGPTLSIAMYPEPAESEGYSSSAVFEAAKPLGMPGWTLHFDDITYHQAPVLSVRAERGDTLAKIAKEMSVDHELLAMANGSIRSARRGLSPGDLVLVPLLIRAVTPAAKKVYPSHALSWQEIMNGWTTLN